MKTLNEQKQKRGFTLVELLLVVTIIGILAGAVLVNFSGKSDEARRSRARGDIQSLETALGLFELDTGDFPATDEGLEALYEDPGIEGWDGPYLTKRIINDPWGNEYQYQYPGNKGINYDLYSMGKDGSDGTDDDIGNWAESE